MAKIAFEWCAERDWQKRMLGPAISEEHASVENVIFGSSGALELDVDYIIHWSNDTSFV